MANEAGVRGEASRTQPKTQGLWARLRGVLQRSDEPARTNENVPDLQVRGEALVLREYRMLATLVGGSGMVALAAIPSLWKGLWVLGGLAGLLYYWLASRRERLRLRLLGAPFPRPWRDVLWRRVSMYSFLSKAEQARFEREILLFMGEQRIYGLGEHARPTAKTPMKDEYVEVSEEQRLLVAASAATLLVGRPEWRLPTTRDIVLYPGAFAEETYTADSHGGAQAIGMVHAQGPILFSLDALEQSFPTVPMEVGPATLAASVVLDGPSKPHVGLHEFAHVLDFIGSEGRAGGLPGMLGTAFGERWHAQLSVERERLLDGRSLLNPYGLKSDAELFAVAVESFFQDPIRLRVYHADLYLLLADFFNQDPAGRLVTHHAVFSFRPLFALGPTNTPLA